MRDRTTAALAPLGAFLTRFAPAVAALTAAVLYGALSILMWVNYYSPSWDLGIFTQLMDQYSKLQAPIVDIKGPGYNLLGDHFHPILILLAPVFAVFPSGLTLMLCQTVLFAASAWPLTSLAFERLSTKGAWLLSFAYVFSFGLLNAVTAQFHEIAVAVPLMAFGLVWWMRGRRIGAAVAIGLLVFCKEDLGLTVAMFGAVVWLKDRRDFRWALGFAVWGVMWFLYAVFVFIPMFNTGGGYDYTDNVTLAQTIREGLTTKLGTVGFLALTAGAIGLRSPYILLMLPTLAWRFAGNVEGYWNLSFHYSAVLMPIAVVALVDAAKRRHRNFAPLVAAITAVALLSQTSIHLLWDADRYKVDGGPAVQAASRYGSVGTDLHLLAYLAPKTHVYWTSTLGGVRPDAIALRPDDTHEPVESWAAKNLGGDWRLVYSGGGYEVVARQS
ncbi:MULTISPECIES: DUF2079 domain-containing protein [Brevibacterium]|nr:MULTISPECIES: DUF2079 domain-containing protein [Brevibacterium]WAL39199.1 DUF2079 domain-containing protein [Brevibacterium sp. BRM-1]